MIIAAFGVAFSFQHKPQAKSSQQSSSSDNSTKQTPIINKIVPPAKAAETEVQGSVHVPILMYHHVGFLNQIYVKRINDPVAIDLTVSPSDFEEQVKYFHDLGYQTVSLQQVYDALENNGTLPLKPIVFTFDDGYKDVLVNAIPILQKYGYTGTFAIATELLGRISYAEWADIIDASKLGMEIVSHTENHLDLTSKIYSDYDLHREIFDSKKILEEKVGKPIDFFVYPYGSYDNKVVSLVKDAGYKMALTVAYGQEIGKDNLLTEPRVRVHGQNGLENLKKIFSPVAIHHGAPVSHSGREKTNL